MVFLSVSSAFKNIEQLKDADFDRNKIYCCIADYKMSQKKDIFQSDKYSSYRTACIFQNDQMSLITSRLKDVIFIANENLKALVPDEIVVAEEEKALYLQTNTVESVFVKKINETLSEKTQKKIVKLFAAVIENLTKLSDNFYEEYKLFQKENGEDKLIQARSLDYLIGRCSQKQRLLLAALRLADLRQS